MANEQETFADIISQMRNGNAQPDFYQKLIDEYADRLEAALKRERELIISEKEHFRLYGLSEHKKVLQLKALQTGNAAAMCEALKTLLDLAHEVQDANSENGPKTSVPAQFIIDVAKSALSASLRNCEQIDAPTDSNGHTIHVGDRVHMLKTDSCGDHEWDDDVCSLEFIGRGGGDEWLIHGYNGAAWACECTVISPAEKGAEDEQK